MRSFEVIKNAFSDDWVQAFSYQIYNKKIEIYFDRYFDSYEEILKDVTCKFVIWDWHSAYSVPYEVEYNDVVKQDLDKNMGIFFMIMDMELRDDFFEIIVNTIDGRFVKFFFQNPKLDIVEIS